MKAYDECYLNVMLQKHRYLYKLIGRNCKDVFSVIEKYMTGDYRRQMDQGNPLFLNKTPRQILKNMSVSFEESAPISEDFDEFILEWMADIYTYMQWNYNLLSSSIVEKIEPKKLYSMYYPLHETSIENGVEKLKKRYEL